MTETHSGASDPAGASDPGGMEPRGAGAKPSPFVTGPLGRCPRCGRGHLFAGFLTLAKRCDACGFDLGFADPGDGPAFFASFLGSTLLLLAGVVLQVAYDPPIWAYALLLIVGAILIVGLIRPIKGLLVALQDANKAEQGRFE